MDRETPPPPPNNAAPNDENNGINGDAGSGSPVVPPSERLVPAFPTGRSFYVNGTPPAPPPQVPRMVFDADALNARDMAPRPVLPPEFNLQGYLADLGPPPPIGEIHPALRSDPPVSGPAEQVPPQGPHILQLEYIRAIRDLIIFTLYFQFEREWLMRQALRPYDFDSEANGGDKDSRDKDGSDKNNVNRDDEEPFGGV